MRKENGSRVAAVQQRHLPPRSARQRHAPPTVSRMPRVYAHKSIFHLSLKCMIQCLVEARADVCLPRPDALWAQDFPWKCSGAAKTSKFEETLTRYLQKAQWKGASGGGLSVDLSTLRKCDFSGARAVLIASVPGRHAGDDLYRFCARPYATSVCGLKLLVYEALCY